MTYRRLLLTAAATSLMLAACNQKPAGPVTGAPIASLPLADAAPPPETAAPPASELPPAPPITRVSAPRQPAYSYIDDAYDLGDAFADSPPDYTVDYDGVQPWVWRSSGGDYRVVEQTSYGEREYFYHDGADYPFLVRDVDYSYAYDDGQLVEVYDSYGRPYPGYGASLLAIAAQYLYRGQHLHYAAIHDQRQAAYAADWRARSQGVLAAQQRWGAEQKSNPDWRQFHEQHVQRQQPQQAAFQQERSQRQAYAQRTAPVIAAAPQAPPLRDGLLAGQRRDAAQDRGAPPPAAGPQGRPAQVEAQAQAGRDQTNAQWRAAQAGDHAQAAAANQQQARVQAQAQVRDQQRAQADAGRASDAAQRQQQAQTEAAGHARDAAQHQQQAQALAQAQHQPPTQNPARDQQKAQVEASNHARDDAMRQQQAAGRAHDEAAHQAQAQAMAQQHQAQAQQHQMAAQQAQAASAQHAQAAAVEQHAQAAAQHAAAPRPAPPPPHPVQPPHPAEKKPDEQKK
jgi:hypothetical protein